MTKKPTRPLNSLLLTLLLLTFPLASCSPLLSLKYLIPGSNPAIHLGVDCPLPCYRALTPNTTHRTEAVQTIEGFGDLRDIYFHNDLIIWREVQNVEGRLLLEGDLVTSISLHYPASTLPVSLLIKTIGEPDALHITLPHPRKSPDPADPQCDILRLIYEKYDAEVVLFERRSGEVQAGHSVQRITLSPSRSSRAILTPFYEREWEGYGPYCIPVKDLFEE
ncbi:MAG: hypothetical protein R6U57_00775 [Anaerolineales bacterium]